MADVSAAAIVMLADELMRSEEEDEDDDTPLIAIALTGIRRSMVPKVKGFVEIVIPSYWSSDFRKDFRVSRRVYESLLNKLTPFIRYEQRAIGRPSLPPDKQLLIFLWYIANTDSMREMSRLFGVSCFTVHRCIRRVSRAICEHLKQQLISWPDHHTQEEVAARIAEKCHIENCVGFIDGTHIRLSGILDNDNDYINRKGYPSIQLQLIVTDDLIITDCFVGWPGCVHDARVYRNSPVYRRMRDDDGSFLAPDKFLIGMY